VGGRSPVGLAKLMAVRPWVEPEHPDVAGVGPPQPLDALNRGGLARPVGAPHAEDLAGGNLEGDVLHGNQRVAGLAMIRADREAAHTPAIPDTPEELIDWTRHRDN
jgi:hypothetical protein